MGVEWLNPYPGTRGFSRVLARSGGKAPPEKFLWWKDCATVCTDQSWSSTWKTRLEAAYTLLI
jgi:hypothetical protein